MEHKRTRVIMILISFNVARSLLESFEIINIFHCICSVKRAGRRTSQEIIIRIKWQNTQFKDVCFCFFRHAY